MEVVRGREKPPPYPHRPQDGESEKAAGHSRIGEGIVT